MDMVGTIREREGGRREYEGSCGWMYGRRKWVKVSGDWRMGDRSSARESKRESKRGR